MLTPEGGGAPGLECVTLLAHRLRVSLTDVSWHGTKDKAAVTTQVRVDATKLLVYEALSY